MVGHLSVKAETLGSSDKECKDQSSYSGMNMLSLGIFRSNRTMVKTWSSFYINKIGKILLIFLFHKISST